jgi:hypothetical protein
VSEHPPALDPDERAELAVVPALPLRSSLWKAVSLTEFRRMAESLGVVVMRALRATPEGRPHTFGHALIGGLVWGWRCR